ncbi:hypothetical protein [Pelagibius sp. Alg239-R121]|uniref:hypothetical protein n=1 Tax=Pelagibius sp. Alg239-R121 TaxID=2993448 RepID=UPI0024A6DBB6|nr:hypothetical protein [Pelagibius sp. Alg239-R121]
MSQDDIKTTRKPRDETNVKRCRGCAREITTKTQKPMDIEEALEIWERLAIVDLAIQGIEQMADAESELGLDQMKALRYFSGSAVRDMAEFLSRLDDAGLYFQDYRKDGLGLRQEEASS